MLGEAAQVAQVERRVLTVQTAVSALCVYNTIQHRGNSLPAGFLGRLLCGCSVRGPGPHTGA